MYSNYTESLQYALSEPLGSVLERICETLFRARQKNRKVFVFGNGGSSSLATHMAGDLGKLSSLDLDEGPNKVAKKRLKIVSLCDNSCWITAVANDIDYRDIYLEQLKNHLEPGDVVIGISGSGSSENVVRAVQYAKMIGAVTITFTSSRQSADTIKKHSDIVLAAPTQMMEQIEDLHLIYHHILARMLFNKVKQSAEAEELELTHT